MKHNPLDKQRTLKTECKNELRYELRYLVLTPCVSRASLVPWPQPFTRQPECASSHRPIPKETVSSLALVRIRTGALRKRRIINGA